MTNMIIYLLGIISGMIISYIIYHFSQENKQSKTNLFKQLESLRITDNNDYISIPIEEWERIKNE